GFALRLGPEPKRPQPSAPRPQPKELASCVLSRELKTKGVVRHPSVHRQPTHRRAGLNVNGSSLPNCSGLPCSLSLSERAWDRCCASWIICGVADVGLPGAVVRFGAAVVVAAV